MKLAIVRGGTEGSSYTAFILAACGIDVILTYDIHAEYAKAIVSKIREQGGNAVTLELDCTEVQSCAKFITELCGVLENERGQEAFDLIDDA